jgi:putative transposase
MPNHVHVIVVPSDEDGLRRTFADAHRRYTGFINARNRWTGHLWQGRFGAVVMDEEHLGHAMRYVSLNPVRARLAERPQDWRWSSVRAHLGGRDDGLVRVAPALDRYGDFASFLGNAGGADDAWRALRRSETSGRPLGTADWVAGLEARTGRTLAPQKRGPKPRISVI